ncbi:MAG: alpha/beta hydrolase-fold protein, partial [Limisphaerales bacterium]
MMRFFIFAGLLLAAMLVSDAGPAPSNIGTAEFPRIEADGGVTFRLKAPNAKSVKLEGGTGLVKEPTEMSRGEDGTWSVRTAPAVPGFHYYWFTVDGLRVNDPASYTWFGWGRDTSGIEIPEAGVDFYEPSAEVARGEVRERWYHSKVTGKWRRAHVYTPAGYDQESRVRYPVLYLQHGAGENERGWAEQGRANFILDSLIAAKRAKPMILVVDTGYASYGATNDSGKIDLAKDDSARGQASFRRTNGPTAAFEEVLLTELIPMIDATYRTRADRLNRAMAGL